MPAAGVIPFPIAYIKVVAVQKLVVGLCLNHKLPAASQALQGPAAADNDKSWRGPE